MEENSKIFNLNDEIKVKLNDWGRELWEIDYNVVLSLTKTPIEEFNVVHDRNTDSNGYTTFQMWEFMRIFGQ